MTLHALWPHTALMTVLAGAVLMAYVAFNGMLLVWLERKVSARFQRRLGPTEVGWAGLLQSAADVIKLLAKQLITPRHVDRPLYHVAPVLVFVPVLAGISLFPFDRHLQLHDFNIGLVLLFALAGLGFLGIFMAGWGSNNKYALLGAMRAVAQNIAYEIPLILATLPVVLLARTMSLREVVEAQHQLWFIVQQPVAFAIYFIAAVAETNRAPFDIPEAESELVAGFHTEYSGMRFAFFFLAEYTNMTIVCMIAATLFLGGYIGPSWLPVPGWVWFFGKVYLLLLVMMWLRWTFPRLRFDQLMSFAWGVLIPLAIVNLLLTAVAIKVWR